MVDDSRHLISVDLASNEFQGAVVNLRGQIMSRFSVPLDGCNGEAALKLVYEVIDRLLEKAGAPVLGIGIGSPGLMDPIQGIVRYSVNLDWRDLPLAGYLKERYKLPVHVANNSQVAALAETTFGANRRVPNLIVVKMGVGIAAGIVLNGQPYYGDGFGAGEIGHLVVKENGDLCRCGHYGCLETLASSRAVLKQAQKSITQNPDSILAGLAGNSSNVTLEMILKACQEGDRPTLDLIDEVGRYMGIAMAGLVCAYNIQQIVVAGIMAGFGQTLIDAIQRHIKQHALSSLVEKTHIETSKLEKDIVILGVAALLMQRELGLT
jgi:N-acetylglucosamine repressor